MATSGMLGQKEAKETVGNLAELVELSQEIAKPSESQFRVILSEYEKDFAELACSEASGNNKDGEVCLLTVAALTLAKDDKFGECLAKLSAYVESQNMSTTRFAARVDTLEFFWSLLTEAKLHQEMLSVATIAMHGPADYDTFLVKDLIGLLAGFFVQSHESISRLTIWTIDETLKTLVRAQKQSSQSRNHPNQINPSPERPGDKS